MAAIRELVICLSAFHKLIQTSELVLSFRTGTLDFLCIHTNELQLLVAKHGRVTAENEFCWCQHLLNSTEESVMGITFTNP